VATLLDAVPSGSHLAISHAEWDLLNGESKDDFDDVMSRMVQQQFTMRNRDQVMHFFVETDLVEPGLVPIEEWRLAPSAADLRRSSLWGAVGGNNVETLHPVETFHAYCVFYFHAAKSFQALSRIS
jgi:hypothetical protein